ncbi:MAG: ATPase [Candidatus Omnitrophica bacterium CG1_02_49_16]|nr:MAG: ATPase [Candidatus Omnitrophica bacterium CG1_02_49_16]
MKLIDRVEELSGLEIYWKKRASQLVVIYGKRRVGKTSLIQAFSQRHPHIYFLADKTTESENLKSLGRAVGKHFEDSILTRNGFKNWYDFFEYLKHRVKTKTVFAIDEFPYLAEGNKAISSVFQKGWDETLSKLPIFLILCGSSIGMMESETLAYHAPLYGRRTAQILVRPFSFLEARNFYPTYDFAKFLEIYSVTGGNPAYLMKLKEAKNLKDALVRFVLKPVELLFEEVEFILKEELREPRQYMSILRAISFGCRKFGEIVNETGIEKSSLHKYLFTLEDLYLIDKEVPVTEKNPEKSRRGLYQITDQFVKFWFNYVYPFKGEIEIGNTLSALTQWTKSFDHIIAANYELAARGILRKHQAKLFAFARVGRWWEGNEEIDLVAVNESTRTILFGEAKWSNKQIGTNIYEDLKRKAAKVQWGGEDRKKRFVLFGKSGFTHDMRKLARLEGVLLFEKDKLI